MSDPAAACAALAVLAERELALVEAGAHDELAAVHEQRVALLDVLGEPGSVVLTAADRSRLQHAARTQTLAAEAMRQGRDALRRELGQSGHARRAAAGYRASAQV